MDGRAYLERAGRSQPANRGCVHIVGPGDIGLDLALSESLGSLLPLVWRQLPRPTKSHALGIRTGTAVTCAREDQFAFKLSESVEDREHQPAMRCRRVGPSIRQRPETGASLARYDEHVACLKAVDQLGQFRAFFAPDTFSA